ncbi:MAG TPA: DUF502 domain-containing protein [Rhizomicrobium sp.]|nr:DUF502 domain-containing protein [Rhizomicrobium sp.]
MKEPFQFVVRTVGRGLLIVVPIYLAGLVLLKAMSSVAVVVRPVAGIFPERFPAERLLSLLLVLMVCFLIGLLVRTRQGRRVHELAEKTLFERIPGYAVIRSLTHRMAGDEHERVWRPAFAEIEEALVPAFIIEEFEDGRYTVFVPSVPTPFAGDVYILEASRVHPLDVPLTQALGVLARWGSGAKDLVAKMEGNLTGGVVRLPRN